MSLILLRHTKPDIAEGICYGATDLDLDASFWVEAPRIMENLPEIAGIVTSPLKRCRKLAERIGEERRIIPNIEPRLAEMDFGTWEGQSWDDVPRAGLEAWARDFMNACPHGGESVAMLAARVKAAIRDHQPMRGETNLIVTHLGVIRAALAQHEGPSGWKAKLGFGETITLESVA